MQGWGKDGDMCADGVGIISREWGGDVVLSSCPCVTVYRQVPASMSRCITLHLCAGHV